VSFFRKGKKIGPSWKFKIGGGVLIGYVDADGELSGENLVYVYPDFTTLLVGKFSKGVMEAAKQTTLIGVKFDKTTKVPYILVKVL
jgi:[histone H3]-lysine4 N-methyltransferase